MSNPFDNQQYNLGSDITVGSPKEYIDNTFLDIQSYSPICIVCGQPATHKLIAKDIHNQTAHLDDKGFICEYHIQMKIFSPTEYKLRSLK